MAFAFLLAVPFKPLGDHACAAEIVQVFVALVLALRSLVNALSDDEGR